MALGNLGNALHRTCWFDEAITAYQDAATISVRLAMTD
jgi:hypothetical protein